MIPKELEESARVDGASTWRIYWQIWMPLARPATAAVAIFTFVVTWNKQIVQGISSTGLKG
jgi:ABC-type glycerol-3-phosphate transport system permease component